MDWNLIADSNKEPQLKQSPQTEIKISGILRFDQRQGKTKAISESQGVVLLHSSAEYAERHVLTGHRESELRIELRACWLAGSTLLRLFVPRARL